MAGSDDIGGAVFGAGEQRIGIGSALAGETAFGGVDGELAAHAVAGVGQVAKVGGHHPEGHIGVQVLEIARAASGQEVRHVGRSVGARLLLDIHDEIFLVALVDLEAGAVGAHPAIGAVEKIADVVAADLGKIAFAAGMARRLGGWPGFTDHGNAITGPSFGTVSVIGHTAGNSDRVAWTPSGLQEEVLVGLVVRKALGGWWTC